VIRKVIFYFVLFFLFFSIPLKSDDQINKLKILLEKGLITENEFKKAIDLLEENKEEKIDSVKIKKISGKTGKEKFVKYEFYIDNFRVHTLSPGTIRIDNMLTGETDVTLSGNFKFKFSDNGKKFFEFEYDKQNLKSNLIYKGDVLINWTGRYVSRYQATFHQMQVQGIKPFHYFIVLPKKNSISINFELFNKKIDKAVAKVKEELSMKYNLSIKDIDMIMEKKNNAISLEQEKIIRELTEKYAGKEITEAIKQEIEATIGEEMANAFVSEIERYTGQAIDQAVENELAREINAAISYAVQQGVSEAAAAAAIEAMIIVYALGGSDEDAMNACRQYAGSAC
jgi:hypothetical protein